MNSTCTILMLVIAWEMFVVEDMWLSPHFEGLKNKFIKPMSNVFLEYKSKEV